MKAIVLLPYEQVCFSYIINYHEIQKMEQSILIPNNLVPESWYMVFGNIIYHDPGI